MTEHRRPSKPAAKPLSALVGRMLADTFARQGFASTELVTHWPEIAGEDVAAHCEPMRMQWPRGANRDTPEPATLVLRVEGPAALEIQHQTGLIIERVNRFFGWRAVGRIVLRQAPLARRRKPPPPPPPSPAAVARVAERLDIADDALRGALARLGAAIKRT